MLICHFQNTNFSRKKWKEKWAYTLEDTVHNNPLLITLSLLGLRRDQLALLWVQKSAEYGEGEGGNFTKMFISTYCSKKQNKKNIGVDVEESHQPTSHAW